MKQKDKAVLYSGVFVEALSAAAEEMENVFDEMLHGSVKYGQIRESIEKMKGLGPENTPAEIRECLEDVSKQSEKVIRDLQEEGVERDALLIVAKGLDHFAKNQSATFDRCMNNALNPSLPVDAQEEKKISNRVKVDFESLQQEVFGENRKEKHQRTAVPEKAGPSKSTAPMGKR
jgi:hypothetical protein